MHSTSDFYAKELESTLREQSFGICDYTITATTSSRCSASVTVLEGSTIQITLKSFGYFIGSEEPKNPQEIYETIEDLLRSTSPLFEQRQREALIEALERLAR